MDRLFDGKKSYDILPLRLAKIGIQQGTIWQVVYYAFGGSL